MQVLKAHTAKHSKDSDIRAVYDRIRSSDAEKIRVWKPSKELEKLESIVDFDNKYAGQSSKSGLGFIRKKILRDPKAQHRKDLTSKLSSLDEQERLVNIYTFAN